MAVAEDPSLKGMNSAMAAIIQFEHEIVTKLMMNCESWLAMTHAHIESRETPKNSR